MEISLLILYEKRQSLNLVTYRHSTHFETITSEHSKLGIILFPRLGPDQLVNNVIEY